MITIRECENCGYQPVTFEDTEQERYCKHCRGLLKIIKRGE